MPDYPVFDPKFGYEEEDVLEIFGADNVRIRGDGRYTVKDPIFPGSFDISLADGTCSKKIDLYEAGIFFRGVSEFYLDVNSPECDPFKIGNVEVSVCPCSSLTYFLIGRFSENIGIGYELREGTVVRLEGVTSESVLEYLDKALFKIGISQDMGMVWPTAGVELSPDYFSEYLNSFSAGIGDRDFKHTSPINSFNGAMRSGSKQEKFLYLYKILEFFWRSAFSEKVVALRTSRLDDSAFAVKILELNNLREIERLKHLMEILIDEDVEEVLSDDIQLEFESPEKLAAIIYDFRNSIVHAKEENIDKAVPAERFSGEFSNEALLEGTEYLALKAIERWGIV